MNDINENLYKILQIDRNSDEIAIKESYRNLAMKFHPDKNDGNDIKFKEIGMAYEILKNNKTRELYDKYGMKGINIYKHFGGNNIITEILLDNTIICKILYFFTTISILITIFIILFSLKIESIINNNKFIPWDYIFIIIWVLNLNYFIISGMFIKFTIIDNYYDNEIILFEMIKKNTLVFVNSILIFLFEILLIFKLNNYISTWFLVFSPLIIQDCINITSNILTNDYFKDFYIYSCLNIHFTKFLTEILIILDIDNILSINSIFIVLPLLIKQLIEIFGEFNDYISNINDNNITDNDKNAFLIIMVYKYIFYFTNILTMILFVIKLNYNYFNFIIIFVPYLIYLAFFICCCGLCIPLILIKNNGDVNDIEYGLITNNLLEN